MVRRFSSQLTLERPKPQKCRGFKVFSGIGLGQTWALQRTSSKIMFFLWFFVKQVWTVMDIAIVGCVPIILPMILLSCPMISHFYIVHMVHPPGFKKDLCPRPWRLGTVRRSSFTSAWPGPFWKGRSWTIWGFQWGYPRSHLEMDDDLG